jgi:hypothetical protein
MARPVHSIMEKTIVTSSPEAIVAAAAKAAALALDFDPSYVQEVMVVEIDAISSGVHLLRDRITGSAIRYDEREGSVTLHTDENHWSDDELCDYRCDARQRRTRNVPLRATMRRIIQSDEYQSARSIMLGSKQDRYATLLRFVKIDFTRHPERYRDYETLHDVVQAFWTAFCYHDPATRRPRSQQIDRRSTLRVKHRLGDTKKS